MLDPSKQVQHNVHIVPCASSVWQEDLKAEAQAAGQSYLSDPSYQEATTMSFADLFKKASHRPLQGKQLRLTVVGLYGTTTHSHRRDGVVIFAHCSFCAACGKGGVLR